MVLKRKETKQLNLGNLDIGSDNPVYIQSMPKIKVSHKKFMSRVKKMVDIGCDILRIAVRDKDDIEHIEEIVNKIKIPLIADIHFNYKLALESIKKKVDGIRLNPANIYKNSHIKAVVKKAKEFKVPIRVGVNSGSFRDISRLSEFSWAGGFRNYIKEQGVSDLNSVKMMVRFTMDYIRFLKSLDFDEIMVSIKSEDVLETIKANQMLVKRCNYPLHLGVTATGTGDEAVVKSSIGIGALLSEGIGDIIRVSLTSDPFKEIEVAKSILSGLNLRKFGPEIISCPTCGRSKMDVIGMVEELKKETRGLNANIRIAIMGCEVNGPGEAKHADIGIAGAGNSALLFKKGKKIKKIKKSEAVKNLIEYIKKEY